ncbi:MAG: TolC family protein [Planctomycetota bacterium]
MQRRNAKQDWRRTATLAVALTLLQFVNTDHVAAQGVRASDDPTTPDSPLLQPYFDRFRSSEVPSGTDGDHENALASVGHSDESHLVAEAMIDVSQPLWQSSHAVPTRLSDLLQSSLLQSPAIQALLLRPQVEYRDVIVAEAEFDTTRFIDSRLSDASDPIGSELVTGNDATRFRDQNFNLAAGLRKRSRTGANFEIAQRLGLQKNNSTFLIPNPQSTTRLELNLTQPLAQGRGRQVNEVRIVLAQLDASIELDRVRSEMEARLLRIASTYWELYRARAELVSRRELLRLADALVENMARRREVDVSKRQWLKTLAQLQRRQANLVAIEAQVKDIQSRLRALTGDPQLGLTSTFELLPQERPTLRPSQHDLKAAFTLGLQYRADVSESIRQISVQSARLGLARNQLLPRLDLILNGYVAGLDDRNRWASSFGDQFTAGRPTVAGGFTFELPRGNRAAQARFARERLEFSRTVSEFQQTTEDALTDIEIAQRTVQRTWQEAFAKRASAKAARAEMEFLDQRLRLLPEPEESVIVLTDDLLTAQVQYLEEETDAINALTQHALAHTQLQHAMGLLLTLEHDGCSPVAPSLNLAEELALSCDPVTDSGMLEVGLPGPGVDEIRGQTPQERPLRQQDAP